MSHGLKKLGRKASAPRRETLAAFTLIAPGKDTPKTWPKANPSHALPRAIPSRLLRSRANDPAYLKSFGSRPDRLAQ